MKNSITAFGKWVCGGKTVALAVVMALVALSLPAEEAPSESFQDALLDEMVGSWTMRGTLMGDEVEYSVEAEWVLNHQFLRLKMHDIGEPSQYEAAVSIGFDSKKNRYVAHWLDRFGGGPSSTLGFGKSEEKKLELLFDYPSGAFRDTFTFDPDSGRWHFFIEAREPDGSWSVFSNSVLTRKKAPSIREVVLLYTNDFESAFDPIRAFWRDDMEHIGGIAQLTSLIEAEREKAPLSFLLDAGDIFTGSLSKATQGELPFELMISMDYDVMAIGNHEFEYGWWVLREAMHRAPFPVLAANLFYEGTEIPFAQPFTILERDGFRIGVIGIFGTDAATALFPPHLAGLEVRDPVAAARKAVARLRPEVDLIILLTHEGKTAPMQTDDEADPSVQRDIEVDIRLAGAVEGVDVLIGGHADAGQEEPFVQPETGTLICQTYGQGTRLGYLKLEVDIETGKIADYDGRLLIVDSDALAPDPTVAAKLAEARARFPEMNEVAGRTAAAMVRRYNEESDIGNLFADVLRAHGSTDVAFVHSGGIRADLPAGPVTREKLLDTFPFTDVVLVVSMTGEQILDVLEQGFTLERGVLQVSGMTVQYDLSKPVGRRVREVRVGDSPLDPAENYSVTTLDFLVSGADLFSGFTGAKVVGGDGPEFADLLEAYFDANDPVALPTRGRLIPVQ